MVTKLKCFNCKTIFEQDDLTGKIYCPKCGRLQLLPDSYDGVDPSDDWLGCIEPEGFEWNLPAGRIGNRISGYQYKTADGKAYLSAEDFKARYGIDPEAAFKYMRSGEAASERTDDVDIGGKWRKKK